MVWVHGEELEIARVDGERLSAEREGEGGVDVARDQPTVVKYRARNQLVDRVSILDGKIQHISTHSGRAINGHSPQGGR